eukprot:TRINITY_DN6998_c0_g1_i5.p1 TRINITY_DN6998_c0_g1~~TRINITY_DN6998_c0_g1_i5.p1  ORF type:complete len:249 (-),score=47.22 TRINITY_DN6998_c0_g1_i5:87-770(-)
MCIRDRVSTQSTWGIKKRNSKMHIGLVKVSLGQDIRLIKGGSSLKDVRESIQSTFGSKLNSNFSLHYYDDDGDYLTITSESDYQAMKEIAISKQKNRKLIIVPNEGFEALEEQSQISVVEDSRAQSMIGIEENANPDGNESQGETYMDHLKNGLFYTGKVIKDVAIKFDQAGDVFYNRVNQALPKLFEWQELVAISNTVKARLSAHYARQGEDQSQNIGIYPPINTQ